MWKYFRIIPVSNNFVSDGIQKIQIRQLSLRLSTEDSDPTAATLQNNNKKEWTLVTQMTSKKVRIGQRSFGCGFFAYSWKLPAYSGAFLRTIQNLSFSVYSWSVFTCNLSFLNYSWQHFLGPGPGLQTPETRLWDDPPQRVCLRSALLTREVLGAGLSQDCAPSVTDPSHQKAISEPFVRQVQVPILAVNSWSIFAHGRKVRRISALESKKLNCKQQSSNCKLKKFPLFENHWRNTIFGGCDM